MKSGCFLKMVLIACPGERQHVRGRVHLVDQRIQGRGRADTGKAHRGDIDEVAPPHAVRGMAKRSICMFNRRHKILQPVRTRICESPPGQDGRGKRPRTAPRREAPGGLARLIAGWAPLCQLPF
jgi:hypothetical protein